MGEVTGNGPTSPFSSGSPSVTGVHSLDWLVSEQRPFFLLVQSLLPVYTRSDLRSGMMIGCSEDPWFPADHTLQCPGTVTAYISMTTHDRIVSTGLLSTAGARPGAQASANFLMLVMMHCGAASMN